MIDADEYKRKAAVGAMIKIALWEGLVLIAVVASYIATGSLAVLIAGIVASAALFTPMFLRWMREHGGAMKPKPNSIEEKQG